MIQVESNRQVLQHPQGGVVGELLVKDGDIVSAGDILLRFDDKQLRSELAIIEGQLFELLARKIRLQAERDGLDRLPAPDALLAEVMDDPEVQALIDGQQGFSRRVRILCDKALNRLRSRSRRPETR